MHWGGKRRAPYTLPPSPLPTHAHTHTHMTHSTPTQTAHTKTHTQKTNIHTPYSCPMHTHTQLSPFPTHPRTPAHIQHTHTAHTHSHTASRPLGAQSRGISLNSAPYRQHPHLSQHTPTSAPANLNSRYYLCFIVSHIIIHRNQNLPFSFSCHPILVRWATSTRSVWCSPATFNTEHGRVYLSPWCVKLGGRGGEGAARAACAGGAWYGLVAVRCGLGLCRALTAVCVFFWVVRACVCVVVVCSRPLFPRTVRSVGTCLPAMAVWASTAPTPVAAVTPVASTTTAS